MSRYSRAFPSMNSWTRWVCSQPPLPSAALIAAPDSVGTWDNFAKETPLKQTSRKMLLMVNDINKNNFRECAR